MSSSTLPTISYGFWVSFTLSVITKITELNKEEAFLKYVSQRLKKFFMFPLIN